MDFFTNTIEIGAVEDLAEGVYMESGSLFPTPDLNPTHDCWVNWKCEWRGHNSGSHSECHVSATHSGSHEGGAKQLVINFRTNFPFLEVSDASGYPITNIGDRTFTITLTNNGNPNENIGFTFQIIVDYNTLHLENEAGQPLHGAIGTKNASDYYIQVVSYQFG